MRTEKHIFLIINQSSPPDPLKTMTDEIDELFIAIPELTKLEQEIEDAINSADAGRPEIKAIAELFKSYMDKALTFGYHAAKDEEKGISSHGYGTRFYKQIGLP